MTGRMSNRDRIAQARSEAEAGEKEKAAAKAAREASPAPARKAPARKAAAGESVAGRVKIVWQVCDQAGRTVETYPYRDEQDARADAARRTEETGKRHFVTRGEETLE